MKLKLVDFKSINISFEFQNKIINIKAEPFKTFEEIKQKVLSKFIDLPNNIHFYYMGQDLSKIENEKIGTIFNHKEQVKIILRLPALKLKSNNTNKLLLKDKNSNIKYQNSPLPKKQISFLNTQFIPTNNKTNLFNLKLIKNQKEYDKKNNDNYKNNSVHTINKISNDKTLIASSSMPNLNLKKSPNNLYPKENKPKNKNNIELNLNNLDNFSFCDKHKYKVAEFCRSCKKFICPECRLSQEHKNHLTIRLDFNNLEENIKLYIMLIQTNEKRNLEIINKNAYSEGDEIISNEVLTQRQDSVIEKCDKIIKNYEFFMKRIQKKLSVDKKNYKTIIINTFNDIALKISKQIGEIVNRLDEVLMERGKKISIEELEYYFNEIATKEETLEFIGDRTIKYLLTSEINRKVENVFDKIENTLEEIINEERPFNLDDKYNRELMRITTGQSNSSNSDPRFPQNDTKINKGILRIRGQRRNGLIFN